MNQEQTQQFLGTEKISKLMIDSSVGVDASVDTICTYLNNKV